MNPARLLLSVIVLQLAACSDDRPPTSPLPVLPSASIADGLNGGGNPDFFFLPPLAADPSNAASPSPYDADAFSPIHQPVVQVCALSGGAIADANGDGLCDNPVALFAGANVKLNVEDQHYSATWNTDPATWPPLVVYRIRVLVGNVELGHVDVSADGALALRSDGRSIPIKFRIERGVLSPGDGAANADYGEGFITNAGGRVLTSPRYAGVDFTPGWLDGKGIPGAFVTIERIPVGPGGGCHPAATGLVQYEGCYRYLTFPDVGQFSGTRPAVVAMCSIVPHPTRDARRLYKSDVGEPVTVLPEVETTLFDPNGLTCGGYPPSSGTQLTLRDRVGARWRQFARAVGRVVGPRTLYAVDLGAGGAAFSFSRIGIGVDVTPVAIDAPDNVLAGSTVPISVLVTTPHDHGPGADEPVPVAGQAVTFSTLEGTLTTTNTAAGGAATVTVVTNALGVATAYWTLPLPSALDNPYNLTASIAGRTATFAIGALSAGSPGDRTRWTLKIDPQRAARTRGAVQTFTALLTNPSQQVLPGQPVTWTISPATGATITPLSTSFDAAGSASLTAVGTAAGTYTITAKGGPVTGTATFVVR